MPRLSKPGFTALSERQYSKASWKLSETVLWCVAVPAYTNGKHMQDVLRNHFTQKRKKKKYGQFLFLRTNFPNRRSIFLLRTSPHFSCKL